MEKARILIVDDEADMLDNCDRILSRDGYECFQLQDPTAFRDRSSVCRPDVVLVDMKMPGMDGLTVMTVSMADDPTVPVIMMTGHATVATAVQAIREGAFDYISKPFTADQLVIAVERAMRHRTLALENKKLREGTELDRVDIIGSSPALIQVKEQALKVAPTEANILITGASGTGKGVFARYIHENSNRAKKPIVAVDCASLPEGLLESELFGHEKGAFTGAIGQKKGLLDEARGGTVFLDEIGDMHLNLQAKLLRALEERTIRRVGGNVPIDIDIRLIAATNVDIEQAVAEGRFREDLFFRINVVPLSLPSLSERRGDTGLLAMRFLARFSAEAGREPPTVSQDVWDAFERYSWPGNVRELRNVAERLIVLGGGDRITLADLPENMRGSASAIETDEGGELLPYEDARANAVRDFQARYVKRLLAAAEGNVSKAARFAGVNRRTVHRWLEELEGPAEVAADS